MVMTPQTIFIQIAAYRDQQLVPTVLDCIATATYPDRLHFCIAWQHSDDEKIDDIRSLKNINIIDIPYMDSQGACWARNKIQQLYNGETFTLQIDSHHRFVQGWDTLCIEMYNQLRDSGVDKPILTTYAAAFNPAIYPQGRTTTPYRLTFDRFTPEGVVFFLPMAMDNYLTLTGPEPGRFYSGHFCFAPGSFCVDVQHDPNYYFHGEEISIAVRAYTHGYDIFQPHKLVLWHEYTREGRTKHWDDHNNVPVPWSKRDKLSHERNRCLFSMDGSLYSSIDWGPYGFGKKRTLQEYERYAGINFKLRSVQRETLDHKVPPNIPILDDEVWIKSFLRTFKHCLDIYWGDVPMDDYEFWAIIFERENGEQIYRKDIDKESIMRLPRTGDFANIWREFQCEEQPKRWVVWPYSKSKGWCRRIVKDL